MTIPLISKTDGTKSLKILQVLLEKKLRGFVNSNQNINVKIKFKMTDTEALVQCRNFAYFKQIGVYLTISNLEMTSLNSAVSIFE